MTALDSRLAGDDNGTGDAPAAPSLDTPRDRRAMLHTFTDNRLAVVGVSAVLLMFAFCFFGPFVYHSNQVHTNLNEVTLPPGKGHPLGTDGVGYDVLGRLMVGGRTSLTVGLAAAVIATFIGALWGAISGYASGFIDSIMMRIVDVLLSIPTLFLLLFMASVFQPSTSTLILVISGVSWLITSRLMRGEVLTLKVREYVGAAGLMGGSHAYRLLRHVMPNAVGTIAVNVTFQVADSILLLASMSYLGLGVQAPQTDWGGMLSDGVNYSYDGYWWLIYPAGLAIVITVVAFNFIGDALRDALESRLRSRP